MMGRKRKHDKNLPQRMYCRRGAYYYVGRDGAWQPLGRDLAKALAKYQDLHQVRHASDSVPSLFQRVLAAHKQKVSANTYTQYRLATKQLSKILAEFAVDQVTPRDIAQIKRSMAHKPNMCNRMLSFLRLSFEYALEWGECSSNPVIGIKRHAEKKRGRYITDEEYALIYAKAGPRLQVIMDLCYFTAQRINDVLKIRRADITDDGIMFQQGKTGTKITVAWSPGLRNAVERAKALPGGKVRGLCLLVGKRGGPPSYSVVVKQYRKAVRDAGLEDATIHDLRAKSITDAKRQGLDPKALAGHTDARMTERYIRLRESPLVYGPGANKLPS